MNSLAHEAEGKQFALTCKGCECPPTIQHEEGCPKKTWLDLVNGSPRRMIPAVPDCTCSRQGECKDPKHEEQAFETYTPPTGEKQCDCYKDGKTRECDPECDCNCHFQEKEDWEAHHKGNCRICELLVEEAKEEGRRENVCKEWHVTSPNGMIDPATTARLEVIAQVEEWVKENTVCRNISSKPNTSKYEYIAPKMLESFLCSLKTNLK